MWNSIVYGAIGGIVGTLAIKAFLTLMGAGF